MSHGIMSDDEMFSVREKPWHGLGIILPDHPDIEEAKQASGLTWSVRMAPCKFGDLDLPVPKRFVVREDTNRPLGVVGPQYVPYQNAQMWDFIETFKERSGADLETAGSLWYGACVWVLLTNGNLEYLEGDPITQHFLFRHSFDGSSAIQCLFTNVRVVCNNTLNMAMRGAANVYSVRHTKGAEDRMQEVDRALNFRYVYEERMSQAMGHLLHFPVMERQAKDLLAEIYPEAPEGRGETMRQGKMAEILRLYETGAGTELPGVRGTAYGLLNAIAEHTDHHRRVVRAGRSMEDLRASRFLSIVANGPAAQEKQYAFEYLLQKAA